MNYCWGPRYQVIGTDCCLATTERMRIGADGNLSLGNDAAEVHERYCFQTAEVAQIFARILNKDLDSQVQHVTLSSEYAVAFNSMRIDSSWMFNQREVARSDGAGKLLKLDLPYIVWTWIKLSAGARFLRTLWYGVGHG